MLEDDDVAVLDLISRTGGDLMQGRGVSGSVAREPNVESYTRDGMVTLVSNSTKLVNTNSLVLPYNITQLMLPSVQCTCCATTSSHSGFHVD